MSTVAVYFDHDNLQEEREESQRKQLVQSQNTISVVLSIFSPLSFIAGYNTQINHALHIHPPYQSTLSHTLSYY